MIEVPSKRALLAALSLALAVPGAVIAQDVSGSGPNHVVNVQSSTPATTVARSGIQAASTGASSATPTNLAIANAHDCTGCQARAASFQAAFLTGDPTYVSPRNVAAATTSNCDGCATIAYAYQYAITTGGPVRLSDAAREKIDALRDEATTDINSDSVTYDELDAELHDVAQRFRAVIDSDLRRVGADVEDRESHQRVDIG
jgi:hypothetical protein